MQQTISVIINTYNEENNIDLCLNRLKWVDEKIIVDMYSSDKTIDISNKYTKKIYYYKNYHHVEPARNYAINKATSDWILIIDGDEYLLNGANTKIRALVSNNHIDGYLFPRRNYISDKTYLKHGYFYPDYQLRLFRNNGKIRYSGRIHEQPVIPKEKTKIIDDIEIIHNPSHTKWGSFLTINRFFNYVKIEGEELAKDKKKSTPEIFGEIFVEFLKHFYRCFIKLHGYKDGYPGFRAAVLYGLYKAMNQGYAFYLRLKYHDPSFTKNN